MQTILENPALFFHFGAMKLLVWGAVGLIEMAGSRTVQFASRDSIVVDEKIVDGLVVKHEATEKRRSKPSKR